MNRAKRPVQTPAPGADGEYELRVEERIAPELVSLRAWLPAAMPTDGQPYARTRLQRHAPPAPARRTYPFGIDVRSSEL